MERLFAPWRMEFITGKREEGCVFCKAPAATGHFRENLVLHMGRLAYVIMNRFPYGSGHLLVIPLRHTPDFTSLTAAESVELSQLLQRSMQVLADVYHPEGFNVGMNLGSAGGAGIREHLHWHLLPRWFGDTNFLPVFSDTKSIPEFLTETYDRLRPVFDGAAGADPAASGMGGSGP